MASQMVSVRFSDDEIVLLKSCQKVTLADGTEVTVPLATLIRDIVTQAASKIKEAE